MLVIILTILALVLPSCWTANLGTINIKVNGDNQVRYVISGDWARSFVKVSSSNITLTGGGRVYLGISSSDTIAPSSFYHVPLIGKRFTYTVDLSRVGCSCNAALYALAMPAYNSSMQPAPGTDGEYYCDADKLTGYYCPDMDIMEANKYAMASTAHACPLNTQPFYSTCDRKGCGKNVLEADAFSYGPGKRIDTDNPFTISVSFITDGRNLTKVNNNFYQSGQNLNFDSCNSEYLPLIGHSLSGMVITMSVWGIETPGGMSWLDGISGCDEGCNVQESRVVFSDFKLDNI